MDPGSFLQSRSDHLGLDSNEVRHLQKGGDFEKCKVLEPYPRFEMEPNFNRLIESTIKLAANVTELAEVHQDLVNGSG